MSAPSTTDDRQTIAEQVAYYRARAPEYDDWFFRRGDYDVGPALNRVWHAEVATLRRAVDATRPEGRVLELACGTGLWTARLAPHAASMTCVDASPEVIALNRRRVGDAAAIDYVQADLFTWRPSARYDYIFFGFWLSHVPPRRFIPFWETVRRALAPGGRVVFVDSRYHPAARARDHAVDPTSTRSRRRLRDGREFEIVKIFYRPPDLARQLRALGWSVVVHATPNFFLHGAATRREGRGARRPA